MSAQPIPIARPPVPNYGIDADRVLGLDSPTDALRRRVAGRYAVDEFGGDPHVQDLVAPLTMALLRVEARYPERVPLVGPALVIANRGLGIAEPLVLGVAVRRAARRRLRVIGAPEVPVVGPFLHKLGMVGYRSDDLAALLRAGHLAAAPLGPTWLRPGAGEPPRSLLAATLGFPVLPAAILPGGPGPLALRPWRVVFGEPLAPPPGTHPGDQLAAAEMAAQVCEAVRDLLEEPAAPGAAGR